jgi:hypothetical protein
VHPLLVRVCFLFLHTQVNFEKASMTGAVIQQIHDAQTVEGYSFTEKPTLFTLLSSSPAWPDANIYQLSLMREPRGAVAMARPLSSSRGPSLVPEYLCHEALSVSDLRLLLAMAEERKYTAKSVIVDVGASLEGMYFIATGSVLIHSPSGCSQRMCLFVCLYIYIYIYICVCVCVCMCVCVCV